MHHETESIWKYRNDVIGNGSDLIGYDVEAIDGHIGKIDEQTVDSDRYSLVVDTGFWIFGKKREIPAGTVERINHDERKIFVHMTKDNIKGAPEYVTIADRSDFHWRDTHDDYYRGITDITGPTDGSLSSTPPFGKT